MIDHLTLEVNGTLVVDGILVAVVPKYIGAQSDGLVVNAAICLANYLTSLRLFMLDLFCAIDVFDKPLRLIASLRK